MKKIFIYLTILSIIVINGCDDEQKKDEQKKSNNNPSAPELTSPTNSETDVKIDATLNWKASTDKDGDVVKYNVYFGTKNPPVDIVSALQSGTTYIPTLSEGTIYYWKISADDGKGGVTESSVWSFTTLTTPIPTPTNHNPSIPVLTSPADQTSNLPLTTTLEWEAATDEDGDAVKYDVWFSTDLPPDDIVSPLQTTTSYTPTLQLSTTYFWQIKTSDGKGGTSESVIRTFTTTNGETSNPPSVPNLLLPLPGSTNYPLNGAINWNSCIDPDGDHVRYDVYFGTTSPPTIAKSIQPDTFFTPTLASKTTYYWKIIAKDDKGTSSESEIRSFTTYDETSTTLNLFSPPKSSTKIKLNELLRWNEWKTTSGGTVKYNVFFSTANPPTTQVSTDQLTTTYTPSLTAGNTYYWKVIANDGNGNTAESEVWSFSTISNPPPKPTLTSPINSSTNIPLTQTLNWDAIVDGNKTIKYNVFFGTASPPTKLVSNLQSANSFTPTLSGNKTYYWKIVADNGEGGQSESDIFSFKTINNAPAKPALITPTDAATDVNITEALKWASSIDPDGDIVKYNVFFGTTDPPTTKVASSLSSTSYSPSLVGSTKYYWKVSADDGSGGITESDVRSFTTKAVASNVPILTAPDNNAVNISLNPTLTWNASTISGGGAVKYDVYFDKVNPPVTKVSTSQDGTSYVPTNVVANTTYYWKVVANGEFASEVRSFTTIKPPTVPAISSPAKGATDVSVNIELVWNPSTSAAGYTITYNVFLDTFPTPVTKVSSSQSGTKYSATKLFSGNTYYWKIVADDGHGGITESEIRSFKTIIIKPSVSVLVSPANDNTNTIPISVTLSWKSSITTSGKKARYDIYLGTAGNTPKVRSLQPDTFYTVTLLSNTLYSWKVASDDGKGGVIESNVFTFKTAITPPKLPFAISPANSATGVALDSKISWYSSTSYSGTAAKYNVFFGTDATPTAKVGTLLPDTFYIPTKLLSNTDYYWKLSIDDGNGGVTNSEIYSFKTALVPPTIPVLTSPNKNALNIALNSALTWSASTGYSGNVMKYNVYLSTVNPPTTKVGDMLTTLSVSHTLTSNSLYYWKVEADDGNGGKTSTEVSSFRTINEPPTVPVLIYPTNSLRDLDLNSTILKWNKSKSTVSGGVKYNVFFDTLFPPAHIVSTEQTDTTYTPTLYSNSTYYWKIEAVDANGDASESDVYSFVTKKVVPSFFTYVNPQNGQQNINFGTEYLLIWQASTSYSDKPIKYNVYLDTLTNPVNKISSEQTQTEIRPTILFSNTVNYWKVEAVDGRGGSTIPGVLSFSAVLIPPSKPALTAPENSGIKVSLSSKLTWTASTGHSGRVLRYEVYFGTSNTPPLVSTQVETSYTPTLAQSTTYYWKVIADDGRGGRTESDLYSFTTSVPPTVPVLVSPDNNVTIFVKDTFFSWNASTSAYGHDITYNIYLGTDNPPTTKVKSNHTGTQYTPTLLPNTKYYWKIEADDGNGGKSVSEVRNFTVFFIEMVYVEAGKFKMGCVDGQVEFYCDSDQKPIRTVTLSKNYSIGKFEVTQAQWILVMGSNPSGSTICDNCPVNNMLWNTIANDFIPKLNTLTGKNYRLPTEAEWEYAARGGKQTKNYQYAGGNNRDDVSWNIDNSDGKTHSVGLKTPNELGIYDMSGNVSEYVSDWYGDYPANDETDPVGPGSSSTKVTRGGGYGYSSSLRIAGRGSRLLNSFANEIGFRLVLP